MRLYILALLVACASSGGNGNGGSNRDDGDADTDTDADGDSDKDDEKEEEEEDPCGDDRGNSTLGGVCREDCDCAEGYTCYTDEYDEQCCAEHLSDLENGAWGIDCDGVQGPPAP